MTQIKSSYCSIPLCDNDMTTRYGSVRCRRYKFCHRKCYVGGEEEGVEAIFIPPTCPSFMFSFATLPSASWISTWTSSHSTVSSVSCTAPPELPTLITPTIQVTPSAHSFVSASVIALLPRLFLTSSTPVPDLDQQGFLSGLGVGPHTAKFDKLLHHVELLV